MRVSNPSFSSKTAYSDQDAHATLGVNHPGKSLADVALGKAAPQTLMAGLQAAARDPSLRPNWTVNEHGEKIDKLDLFC